MVNLGISNAVIFKIKDPLMTSYFQIDSYGNFKIIVNKLEDSDSPYGNGTFLVPVLLTDLHGCSNSVLITVQLSKFITNNRCPQISDKALCSFSINKTDFDPSKLFNQKYTFNFNLSFENLTSYNNQIWNFNFSSKHNS